MDTKLQAAVAAARAAAVAVLRHNVGHGRFAGLPRTAGWGYPEPYTRDLMLSSLGFLASGHPELVAALRRCLVVLARHQSPLGQMPSLIHDPMDRGASDTTPLFLLALALYRRHAGAPRFLERAAAKARTWLAYQSPTDDVIVGQLPTSDWRDEQWVLGCGLFVNAIVYGGLRLAGDHARAARLRNMVDHRALAGGRQLNPRPAADLRLPGRPYYAIWAYKIYKDSHFDLLGNSLAILTGLADRGRARAIVRWVEARCRTLRRQRLLALDLPPNFFPYLRPGDPDWRPRYARYNRPGEYHNGGVWPVAAGLYVAACVAAGRPRLAERKLAALTALVRPARDAAVEFGFNEWFRAQDGTPRGQDWQLWSAALYVYAADCVTRGRPLFFETRQRRA